MPCFPLGKFPSRFIYTLLHLRRNHQILSAYIYQRIYLVLTPYQYMLTIVGSRK